MHLATYLGLLHAAEKSLAEGFRRVGAGHAAEPDVRRLCEVLPAGVTATSPRSRRSCSATTTSGG